MKSIKAIMVTFIKKYLPDAFTIIMLMSILVLLFCWILTDYAFVQLVDFWGDGLFSNLDFIMQMLLVLLTGHTLAISPAVASILKKIASVPQSRLQVLLFTYSVSFFCGYLNWGFGLVAAAIIAKEMAVQHQDKGIDYPLLVAASYAATQVIALSSAIPLQVAAEGHFLQDQMGIIPLNNTLFAPINICITFAVWVGTSFLLIFLNPPKESAVTINILFEAEEKKVRSDAGRIQHKRTDTFAEKMDHSPLISSIIVFLFFVYIVNFFIKNGFLSVGPPVIIMIFLAAGILAHKTPAGYIQAVYESIRPCAGIVLLFPFYYGLMGLLGGSGLASQISYRLLSISTPKTFTLVTFISAAFVNLLIPSAGGQWAVQGPVMIPAAIDLGLDLAQVVLAVSWGDLWTNLLQPFWTIPVLSIAGLNVKDIMGYCMIIGFVEGIIICAAFLFF